MARRRPRRPRTAMEGARTWACVSADAPRAWRSRARRRRAPAARNQPAAPPLRDRTAGQAQPQDLREVVIEPHRRAQHLGVLGRSRPSRQALSSTRAVEVSRISGRCGGVNELQILRDELDIDQPAGDVFEVPAVAVALLGRDRAGASRPRRRRPPRHRAAGAAPRGSRPRPARRRPATAETTRARQRHVLPGPGLVLLIAREAVDLGGERPGAARGPQPHVDLVEHAVVGLRGERADQPLRQPREILAAVERARAVGLRVLGSKS